MRPRKTGAGPRGRRSGYDLIAGTPLAADGIAEWVEGDLLTTVDYGNGSDHRPGRPRQTRLTTWATNKPAFGRDENGEVSVDTVSPWNGCYDIVAQETEDIDRLATAVHEDFVELLDYREAFRVSE